MATGVWISVEHAPAVAVASAASIAVRTRLAVRGRLEAKRGSAVRTRMKDWRFIVMSLDCSGFHQIVQVIHAYKRGILGYNGQRPTLVRPHATHAAGPEFIRNRGHVLLRSST